MFLSKHSHNITTVLLCENSVLINKHEALRKALTALIPLVPSSASVSNLFGRIGFDLYSV
jgi:hypothetical protein